MPFLIDFFCQAAASLPSPNLHPLRPDEELGIQKQKNFKGEQAMAQLFEKGHLSAVSPQ